MDPQGKPGPPTWLQSHVALALTGAPLLLRCCGLFLCMQVPARLRQRWVLLLTPTCRESASLSPSKFMIACWGTIQDGWVPMSDIPGAESDGISGFEVRLEAVVSRERAGGCEGSGNASFLSPSGFVACRCQLELSTCWGCPPITGFPGGATTLHRKPADDMRSGQLFRDEREGDLPLSSC